MKNLKLIHSPGANGLLVMLAVFLFTGAASVVDPTRPPDNLTPGNKKSQTGVTGTPKLSAIFITKKRSFAVIDGTIAGIGDQIGAYTVTNIHVDTVELRGSQNDSVVLPLLPTVRQARIVNEGK